MIEKHFYERNDYICDHLLNVKFEDLLDMGPNAFKHWVVDMRAAVLYGWDKLGQPPRVGWNEDTIVDHMEHMAAFPVHTFWRTDAETGERNIIRNTSIYGNCANQWFPTMMKTRINYTENPDDGKSIYDWFADPDLLDRFHKYALRHFRRDGFFHYSLTVPAGNAKDFLFNTPSGIDWIEQFEAKERPRGRYDYWLAAVKDDVAEYSGHNAALKAAPWLTITEKEVKRLGIPKRCRANMHLTEGTTYYIRLFKLGQKVFPVGLKAFRVSFCQYAVNFPPLTAKLIYETYTEDLKDQEVINVYDPSAGWGGRILGAMAVKDDRNIHYIGTDPNTDHLIEDGQRTKYEDLAEFYNTRTTRGSNLFPHTHSYEIFRVGSEVIHKHPDFQQYKGLVDFIFTSPPYFSKEKYSDDPEQSCAKFTTYEAWRDGFLWPTLETCVEWLKPNRYLAWNVANIKLGNKILPIEDDSVAILEELGCDYITTLRMTLASAPGANRVDEDGKPRTESFCTVVGQNGKEQFLKYEPVLIFLKH